MGCPGNPHSSQSGGGSNLPLPHPNWKIFRKFSVWKGKLPIYFGSSFVLSKIPCNFSLNADKNNIEKQQSKSLRQRLCIFFDFFDLFLLCFWLCEFCLIYKLEKRCKIWQRKLSVLSTNLVKMKFNANESLNFFYLFNSSPIPLQIFTKNMGKMLQEYSNHELHSLHWWFRIFPPLSCFIKIIHFIVSSKKSHLSNHVKEKIPCNAFHATPEKRICGVWWWEPYHTPCLPPISFGIWLVAWENQYFSIAPHPLVCCLFLFP